jgi:hypothetical protein
MAGTGTTAASRVVLGLGGCVDYELTLTAAVLEELIDEHGIAAADLATPGPLTGERDLVVSILGWAAPRCAPGSCSAGWGCRRPCTW